VSTGDGATRFPQGRHPDTARLDQLARAVAAWLERPWPSSPTSSVSGGGAIAQLEGELARLVAPAGDAHGLLLPAATYGLRVALEAVGVGPGAEVVLPVIDWPSSYAAVLSLGARPVPVAVSPSSLTLDLAEAAAARTSRTAAAVVCHLHGVPGRARAVREALGVPVVEDAAGALGSQVDGSHVGAEGDAVVLSLGPGKQLDCFEGGVVVTRDPAIHDRAVALSAHPLRQLLHGLDPESADPGAFALRGHPATALVGLLLLSAWDPAAERHAHHEAAHLLNAEGWSVLGAGGERLNAAAAVPVLLDRADGPSPAGAVPSGAQVLPCPDHPEVVEEAVDLLARTRLVPVTRP
jgi:hypothetical protein